MKEYPDLLDPVRRDTEMAQDFGRENKHFSLIVRADYRGRVAVVQV
jgi:hypothetical protein